MMRSTALLLFLATASIANAQENPPGMGASGPAMQKPEAPCALLSDPTISLKSVAPYDYGNPSQRPECANTVRLDQKNEKPLPAHPWIGKQLVAKVTPGIPGNLSINTIQPPYRIITPGAAVTEDWVEGRITVYLDGKCVITDVQCEIAPVH